jgi:pantoate--beta-alanine ligase
MLCVSIILKSKKVQKLENCLQNYENIEFQPLLCRISLKALMIIFKKIADLQHYLSGQKAAGAGLGFVPTMGALHPGHISLIGKAKADNTLVICSIFVNPTQFNDPNDFEKYPISIESDIELLIEAGCDVLFLPSVAEIYPNGTANAPTFDFGYLNTILEGAQRPGHFKGVGQVVAALINAVQPNKLYLGQKDYQQCMVIRQLIKLMGKENELQLVICPTTREADGLAMSSRNRRLSEFIRPQAATIYQCLVSIESKQKTDSFETVKKECIELLKEKGFAPEYVALANANDLTLLDDYQPDTPTVALIAAKLGDVRLIDNLIISN